MDDRQAVNLRDAAGVVSWRGARYTVGEGGDQVLVGDWNCDGEPTPALLRPSTGQVFRFDRWADLARSVTVRPVGRVPGARVLLARPVSHSGARCDELVAERDAGPPVVLPPSHPDATPPPMAGRNDRSG